MLASPRGGVPIGSVVADALGAGFDLLMARRIDAGVALDDTGETWRTNSVEADSRAGSLRAPLFDQLCLQRAVYTPVRKPADPGGRVVIVVDDGLMSGATMHAALASLRKRHPARLVCALPIATRSPVPTYRPSQADTGAAACLHLRRLPPGRQLELSARTAACTAPRGIALLRGRMPLRLLFFERKRSAADCRPSPRHGCWLTGMAQPTTRCSLRAGKAYSRK